MGSADSRSTIVSWLEIMYELVSCRDEQTLLFRGPNPAVPRHSNFLSTALCNSARLGPGRTSVENDSIAVQFPIPAMCPAPVRQTSNVLLPERLRADAERRAAQVPRAAGPERPADDLAHELLVQQIELEMQNEELRRALVSLETARDRYVDLYDFAPVGYASLDVEGRISDINLTGAGLLGVERRALIGQRFARHVSPVDGDRWHRFAVDAALGRQPGGIELALVGADGRPVHVLLNGRRVGAVEGAAGLRISLADISARKQAELALFETAERSRVVENAVLDHVAVLDRHGVITAVNPAWQEFAELHGASAFDSVPRSPVGSNYIDECRGNGGAESAEADLASAGIAAVLSGRQDLFTLEYDCPGPNRQRWFHMSVTPLRAAGGGAVVVHADVTAGRPRHGRERRAVPLAGPDT
jgi:PAS domain S-box-containing protein